MGWVWMGEMGVEREGKETYKVSEGLGEVDFVEVDLSFVSLIVSTWFVWWGVERRTST